MSAAEQIPEEREYWKRVEILRKVAWRLEDMLRERLSESGITDVDCGERFGEYVWCAVGRKYGEISEVVAEGFGEYCEEFCEEEGLSGEACDSACEEEFYRLYEEELERINEENIINIKANIDTQQFDVTVEPLPCEEDFCIVGAEVTVRFKEDIGHFQDEKYRDYWLSRMAEVIATLLKEL